MKRRIETETNKDLEPRFAFISFWILLSSFLSIAYRSLGLRLPPVVRMFLKRNDRELRYVLWAEGWWAVQRYLRPACGSLRTGAHGLKFLSLGTVTLRPRGRSLGPGFVLDR